MMKKTVTIYTDGACSGNPGPGGWGAILCYGGAKKEMSGGEKQRIAIARAVINRPDILLADEPTGNLDSRTSKQVLYRMLEMSKNSGVTFVMVTHEPDLAECADRIVTILDGKVCSNVVQDEETKKKNRDALFADLEGNLDIGGEAAKEQNEKIKDNR